MRTDRREGKLDAVQVLRGETMDIMVS